MASGLAPPASVVFRGTELPVPLSQNSTCKDLADLVQEQLLNKPLAAHTLKLLLPKHATPVFLMQQPSRLLAETGEAVKE